MRRLCAKRWFRVLVLLLATPCLAGLLACWWFRIGSFADYQVYEEVRRYSIGEDLWFRRIEAGQDLEAFTAAHPPHRTLRFGRSTEMSYYAVWPTPPGSVQMESLSVIAADGRLVAALATGCTWHRAFFEIGAATTAEFQESVDRHSRENGLLR
jgi:hypothetical protein